MTQDYNISLLKTISIAFIIKVVLINVSLGQSKVEKIEDLLDTYTEYGQFSGSVLVAEKGEVIFKKGFGMANMEWDIPNRPGTKHRIGSVTKQFTAMLVIQLVEQGKLQLDDPIITYLPDYPKPNGKIITIQHLLTHSSGIPDYTSFPNFFPELSQRSDKPEKFMEIFADSALIFTPGENFMYSNSGYFVLGVIIEKVTGKSYEEVLQENILTPLKMNNSGYDHHGTVLMNRSSGYDKKGSSYVNAPYINISVPYAAGCMYSTVEDMYLWDQALYKSEILSEEYMDKVFSSQMTTPQYSAMGMHYGYGWIIRYWSLEEVSDSLVAAFHTGGIPGFTAMISRSLTDRNLIVLLSNLRDAPVNQINSAITHILYDKPYNMPERSSGNIE